MAWIAVDENGDECIHSTYPEKITGCYSSRVWIKVPKGTSVKLTGRKMTFNDYPKEL